MIRFDIEVQVDRNKPRKEPIKFFFSREENLRETENMITN